MIQLHRLLRFHLRLVDYESIMSLELKVLGFTVPIVPHSPAFSPQQPSGICVSQSRLRGPRRGNGSGSPPSTRLGCDRCNPSTAAGTNRGIHDRGLIDGTLPSNLLNATHSSAHPQLVIWDWMLSLAEEYRVVKRCGRSATVLAYFLARGSVVTLSVLVFIFGTRLPGKPHLHASESTLTLA